MEFSHVERITRVEAKALGLKRYFTGEPCEYGHICERDVGSYGCVKCSNIRSAAWAKAHPEEHRAKVKKYNDKHPERQAAQSKKRRAANPEYHKYYVSKWRDEHPKEYAARLVRWRAENPDKVRASGQRRHAREKGAEGYFSADDIQQLYYNQGGLCKCGKTLFKHHIDHMTPISRGGSNFPSNLQLLCQPCNDSKGARTMDEWRPTCAS